MHLNNGLNQRDDCEVSPRKHLQQNTLEGALMRKLTPLSEHGLSKKKATQMQKRS